MGGWRLDSKTHPVVKVDSKFARTFIFLGIFQKIMFFLQFDFFLGIFHSRGITLFPKNHGSLENGGIFEM